MSTLKYLVDMCQISEVGSGTLNCGRTLEKMLIVFPALYDGFTEQALWYPARPQHDWV
jgi:hypothetical protein